MNKETKYDTKSAREILLQYAGEAYCALGGVKKFNTMCEEELITYAMYKVIEEDTGSEEQFLELRGLSYMLRGIADNLRLMCVENSMIA